MKEHTSKYIKWIGNIFLFFPLTYMIYAAVFFQLPMTRVLGVYGTYSYWILSFCAMYTGYGLKEGKRWSWSWFVFTVSFMTYGNALILKQASPADHKVVLFFEALAVNLLLVFLVAKALRKPYFFPRIRWWEHQSNRYRVYVPVFIQHEVGNSTGEIMDISLGGCFVKTKNEFKDNEKLSIKLDLFGSSIEADGLAVWRTKGSVTHPRGIGIKFNPLQKKHKKTLKLALKQLNKINRLHQNRSLHSQESYQKKVAHLSAYKLVVDKEKKLKDKIK